MSENVKIVNVVKKYDEFKAVAGVSLDIKPGEFFTLLGPSGCGKTTLLRMIAGFNNIDEGEIYFGDEMINEIPAHKRNIGMVFQNYAIFPHMTVKENVAYGLKARKIKGKELEDRVNEAMEMMQISEFRDRKPSQMSGGQQQRIALARAIVIQPGVLLMDEPLSNLDAKLRIQMRSSIRKMQKKLGITTIYVTHDQEEALAISDRIAVMNSGKVEQLGEPEEIYTRPQNQFVANFIGTSNFLPGEVDEKGTVSIMGKPLAVRVVGHRGEVLVSARPEHVQLVEPSEKLISGEIVFSTFLGDFVNYEVELEDGTKMEINEYGDNDMARKENGSKVGIILKESKITIFDGEKKESLPLLYGGAAHEKG